MSDISVLLYRSETDVEPDSQMARQILAEARKRNEDKDLTGFLHHEDNVFFQWLEGPTDALAEVSAMIERDPRHSGMTYLWRGTSDERQFTRWRMGYSVRNDESILAWLAANPVTQRDKRGYALSILEFLQARNCAATET